MRASSIAIFLESFSGTLASSWDGATVDAMASQVLPEELAGSRWDLLTGDLRWLWTEWWVQTFGDPMRLKSADYPTLYAHARAAVVQRFPGDPRSDINAAARGVARLLQDLTRRHRTERLDLTDLDRRELLVEAGDPPRCWICGWAFPPSEVDCFLGTINEAADPTERPLYVDMVLPRGCSTADLRINADHVVPVAAGGSHRDNLRLACGWCNRAKSAVLTTYDVPTQAPAYDHPRLGQLSVPHPLWVVRALATVAVCESPEGCDRTTRTDQLTVGPRWPEGGLTPANIMVTCHNHDPWATVRWVPRPTAR